MINATGNLPLDSILNVLNQRIEADTKWRPFKDDIFKFRLWNENNWNTIKLSLKFIPKSPIGNMSALVQVMAWHRTGDDKPISEPMMAPGTNADIRHSVSI